MNDFLFKNYYNAFVEICLDDFNLAIDPWITNGIYGNSWVMPDEVSEYIASNFVKTNVDCCIITHIHEDHFDATALSSFSDDCVFHVPDIYPNKQVVGRKLKNKRVHFRSFDSFDVNENVSVQFIPPMNYDGYLSGKRQKDQSSNIAIDTGVLLRVYDKKILLLADNMPFDYVSVCDSFDVYGCDLIAFPFNAFADDFPVCFDNISLDKKRKYATQRSSKRLQNILDFFDECNPINVMPYSSDFFIQGKRSIQFNEILPDKFKSRMVVSEGIENSIPLSYNQKLIFDSSGVRIVGDYREFNFSEICKTNYIDSGYKEKSETNFFEMIKLSTINMCDKLTSIGMNTDWQIYLNIIDLSEQYMITPNTREVHVLDDQYSFDGPYIKCNIKSSNLEDLLCFRKHWDNERIAYTLSWERHPDEHEPNVWKALSFFHK